MHTVRNLHTRRNKGLVRWEHRIRNCHSLASSSLGLWPDHYFSCWVSLSLLPADPPTGEGSRAPVDPEPLWYQALGSLPSREEEEVELCDRFLVSIGEERDWHLGFPRDCRCALLSLPLPLPPLPPLLLTVFCSVVPVGVPLSKPRSLCEWSRPTAGLADGPETGGSAPSPTEELWWAGTTHSSSEGWSSICCCCCWWLLYRFYFLDHHCFASCSFPLCPSLFPPPLELDDHHWAWSIRRHGKRPQEMSSSNVRLVPVFLRKMSTQSFHHSCSTSRAASASVLFVQQHFRSSRVSFLSFNFFQREREREGGAEELYT